NIIDDSQTVDVGENGTAASSFAEASTSFFYGNQTSRTGSSSTGSSESTDGTTRRRPRLRGAARYSTFVSLSTGTGAVRPVRPVRRPHGTPPPDGVEVVSGLLDSAGDGGQQVSAKTRRRPGQSVSEDLSADEPREGDAAQSPFSPGGNSPGGPHAGEVDEDDPDLNIIDDDDDPDGTSDAFNYLPQPAAAADETQDQPADPSEAAVSAGAEGNNEGSEQLAAAAAATVKPDSVAPPPAPEGNQAQPSPSEDGAAASGIRAKPAATSNPPEGATEAYGEGGAPATDAADPVADATSAVVPAVAALSDGPSPPPAVATSLSQPQAVSTAEQGGSAGDRADVASGVTTSGGASSSGAVGPSDTLPAPGTSESQVVSAERSADGVQTPAVAPAGATGGAPPAADANSGRDNVFRAAAHAATGTSPEVSADRTVPAQDASGSSQAPVASTDPTNAAAVTTDPKGQPKAQLEQPGAATSSPKNQPSSTTADEKEGKNKSCLCLLEVQHDDGKDEGTTEDREREDGGPPGTVSSTESGADGACICPDTEN
ncbi:unnamed protein product, partial [Amoebophrya sp. A25]